MKQHTFKICGNCKEELPANKTYFNKDVRGVIGLGGECRVCKQMGSILDSKHRAEVNGNEYCGEGMLPAPNKTCWDCKETLPRTTDYFHHSLISGTKDKLQGSCKQCVSKRKVNHEVVLKAHRVWSDKNRGLINQYSAERRAAKTSATPLWVDKNVLNTLYVNCPSGLTVDHVIPLNGRKVNMQVFGETFEFTIKVPEVCGLHVPANLQYLTKSENSRKSNKLIGE
jgi:5-methylcytosine-specific restriction endonuclease McrA